MGHSRKSGLSIRLTKCALFIPGNPKEPKISNRQIQSDFGVWLDYKPFQLYGHKNGLS